MFANVKVLKSMIKSAYKEGITIEQQYGGLAIYTDFWGVWITNEDLTNELKAAVVEVLGALPGKNEAWTCRKERDAQETFPKSIFDMVNILRIGEEQSFNAKVTPLLYMQRTERKEIIECRILQNAKSEQNEIAIINNVFVDWIDKQSKDIMEGNEQQAIGPRVSMENGIVAWYNDRCVMYCYMRDDSEERTNGMIDTLKQRVW